MIKITAKRKFTIKRNIISLEVRGFYKTFRIEIPKEIYNSIDERTLKNYIKNEIYSQMEVKIDGK